MANELPIGWRTLVIAPHADDETLGMGGTIAKRVSQGAKVTIAVMTGRGEATHPLFGDEVFEAVRDELRRACGVLGVEDVEFFELPSVMLDGMPTWQVNQVVRDLIERVRPDEVFLPFAYDLHRDHRELFYAALVAIRPVSVVGRNVKRVLCYEVVSETHWAPPYVEVAFAPNVYENITGFLPAKLAALECFASQMKPFPHARSLSAIEALARFRGSTVGCEAAEAFVLLRALS